MVLYLACFDLSQPLEEQVAQIVYWLDFLHSSLPLPPPPTRPHSDWGILLVGLRADRRDPSLPQIQLAQIKIWKQMWPRLAILNQQVFEISSITSEQSVVRLLNTVDNVCNNMLSNYAMEIPTLYRSMLDKIQQNPPPTEYSLIKEDILYADHGNGIDKGVFTSILRYLHSIGSIIRLREGLICTDPQQVPKLAAHFVSPAQVRLALLKGKAESIQILTPKDVGYLLNCGESDHERCVLFAHLKMNSLV